MRLLIFTFYFLAESNQEINPCKANDNKGSSSCKESCNGVGFANGTCQSGKCFCDKGTSVKVSLQDNVSCNSSMLMGI